MPRKPDLVPKSILKIRLPVEVRAKLDLALYSDVEGRVPLGDYSALLSRLVRQHFEWQSLDLSMYGFPEGYFVRGPAAMVESLRKALTALSRRPE